jgi:hypothetical protein
MLPDAMKGVQPRPARPLARRKPEELPHVATPGTSEPGTSEMDWFETPEVAGAKRKNYNQSPEYVNRLLSCNA